MKLEHFYKDTYIIEGLTTTCVYMLGDGHCILIDNGWSVEEKELIKLLEEQQLIPDFLICTHLHVDHHGNSTVLREKYDAPIVMPEGEADKCRNLMTLRRYVEYPYRDARYKKLIDERIHCRVDIAIPPYADHIELAGRKFGIIHTPGHSCDHISVITPDNVCYLGDVLLPTEAVLTAKLPYTEDFVLDRGSKQKLLALNCTHWIYSHRGTYVGDIAECVKENVNKMDEILEMMYHLLDEKPLTRGVIYREARQNLRLLRHDPGRINEYKRMFRPYLEHLLNTGRISTQDRDGLVYYGHFAEEETK